MGITIQNSTMTPSPNSIVLYVGQSKQLDLDVTEPGVDVDGNPVTNIMDLTGCSLYFTVRSHAGSQVVLIYKSTDDSSQISIVTPATLGQATIFLDYTDTAPMEKGKYIFDVWIKKPDNTRFPIIEPSDFLLKEAITILP